MLLGASPYGASNQRLKATENSVTTYYAADGSGVVTEFLAVGAGWQWQKNYVKWGD